ncbi:glutamate mutase L [Ignavigranum ruoffiae]|uniref:glutamate mutase L n=1 Tax=Ignavigranum ruoffiae TaxID=89093 RepID=UPI003B003A95
MTHYILTADFGSTYSKFNLFNRDQEILVGQHTLPTSQASSVMDCYRTAKTILLNQLDNYSKTDQIDEYYCSSAWGGFRMVVIAFTETLTKKAGEYAALGSGTRIIGSYYYKLSQSDLAEIVDLDPDVILLAGGTNGGNEQFVIEVAHQLTQTSLKTDVIYAGNEAAQEEVAAIFADSNCKLYIVDNVMPAVNDLKVEPVRAIAQEIFIRKITQSHGLSDLAPQSPLPIIPTPTAVMKATECLGQMEERQPMDGVLVVDIGGATTDIHSYGKGLGLGLNVFYEGMSEPLLKRTVEGDLGMRESVASVLTYIEGSKRKEILESLFTSDQIQDFVNKRIQERNYVPQDEAGLLFDKLVASQCLDQAIHRHVGRLRKVNTQDYYQSGKDLRQFSTVVATGGPLTKNPYRQDILHENFHPEDNDLRPSQPNIYFDHYYLMSAIGVLSQIDQAFAHKLLKKYVIPHTQS